jgi:outer membrane biosynthesis protein TonB
MSVNHPHPSLTLQGKRYALGCALFILMVAEQTDLHAQTADAKDSPSLLNNVAAQEQLLSPLKPLSSASDAKPSKDEEKQKLTNLSPILMLYRAQLYQKIRIQWPSYRPRSGNSIQPAQVKMLAYIKRDGAVEDIECIKGSEHKELAEAAKRMLKSLNGKLPPFSAEMRTVAGDYFKETITLTDY